MSLWLGLLADDYDYVEWEHPKTSDATEGAEDGVDARYRSGQETVAAQCKQRNRKRSAAWQPNEIASIVRHAASELKKPDDCAARFVFFTDSRLTDQAIDTREDWQAMTPGRFAEREARFRSPVGNETFTDQEARLLARGFFVLVQDGNSLQSSNESLARLIAPGQERELLDCLRAQRQQAIGRRLHRPELWALLSSPLQEALSTLPGETFSLATRVTRDFIALTRAYEIRLGPRRTVPALRAAGGLDSLLDLVGQASGSSTIRVHGHAGQGKSHLLGRVAQQLIDRHQTVLALNAKDAADHALQNGLLTRLVHRSLHGSRLFVILDQVDELLDQTGEDRAQRMRDVISIANGTDSANCTLILGCRSADARGDLELDALFERARREGEILDHRVGLLEPDQVATVLDSLGIGLQSLEPADRKVFQNPLALKFLSVIGSDWSARQPARSLREVIRRYLKHVIGNDPRYSRAMETILEHFRIKGLRGATRAALDLSSDVLRHFLDSGLLIPASAGAETYHPPHGAVLDHLYADDLQRSADASEILRRVGDRSIQTLAVGRRLRLAIPVLAESPHGASVLDDLMRCDGLRTHMKRALLRGLTEVDRTPNSDVIKAARSWLEVDALRPMVMSALLRGSARWVQALEDWLRAAWPRSSESDAQALLGILASVSIERGDVVASVLKSWLDSANDGPGRQELLMHVERVLPYDPSEDSAKLFELRRRLRDEHDSGNGGVRWKRFFRDAPDRAAAWLRDLQSSLAPNERVESDRQGRFAGVDQLVLGDLDSAGAAICEELMPHWRALPGPDFWEIELPGESQRGSPISALAHVLATAWAARIEEGETSWAGMLREISGGEGRALDDWLALLVGLRLVSSAPALLEQALEWMIENKSAREIKVGPWGASEEWWPAARLALLGSEKPISESTRDRVAEWGGSGSPSPFEWLKRAEPKSRESAVRVAERDARESRDAWTTDQWVAALRGSSGEVARLGEHPWTVEHDLIRRIRSEPTKWVDSIPEFADHLPAELTVRLTYACVRRMDSSHADEPDRSLSPADVVMLASDPRMLPGDEGIRTLSMIVRERPVDPWQAPAVDRLLGRLVQESARDCENEPDKSENYRSRSELLDAVYNDTIASIAIGLASLPKSPGGPLVGYDAMLTRACERLADSHRVADRVAAAILAPSISVSARKRVLLRAGVDPLAAIEPIVARQLFWIAESDADRSRDAFATLERGVRQGDLPGFVDQRAAVAVGLAARGRLSPVDITRIGAENSTVRVAVARAMGRSLRDGPVEQWHRDVAAWLFDSTSAEDSSESAARALLEEATDTLLRDESFIDMAVGSRWFRGSPRAAVEFFDRCDRLFESSALVLDLANEQIDGRGEGVAASDWKRRDRIVATLNLLGRLADAAERREDKEQRSKALDAYDAVLTAFPYVVPG